MYCICEHNSNLVNYLIHKAFPLINILIYNTPFICFYSFLSRLFPVHNEDVIAKQIHGILFPNDFKDIVSYRSRLYRLNSKLVIISATQFT